MEQQLTNVNSRLVRVRYLRQVLQQRQLGLWTEHHHVRRSTKVERPNLVSLLDPIPFSHCQLDRRDLHETDANEAHQPDVGVVRLDENDGARADGGLVSDGASDDVHAAARGGANNGGVVRTRDDVRLDDTPIDGAMPAVVIHRAEDRLEDLAIIQLSCEGVVVEHMLEGVGLLLDPELGRCLHVLGESPRDRLTGVVDKLGFAWLDRRTSSWLEAADEEVVPGREVPVGLVSIAHPCVLECRAEAPLLLLQRVGAEPAVRLLGQDIARPRGDEESGPLVKDLVDHFIHFRFSERAVAGLGVAERCEDTVHWNPTYKRADQAEGRGHAGGLIENNEEFQVVRNLTP